MEHLPIPKERDVFFSKQVDQNTIEALTKTIIEYNREDEKLKKLYAVYEQTYTPKPINIFIDSYGGAVYQCFGLLSIMENSATPIHTYVTGAAMSCGFLILIHGHKKFAYKNATPMYHQVSSGAVGTIKEIEETVGEVRRLQDKIVEFTVKKTKIPKKKLLEVETKKQDWFMSAQEALKLGVVDCII